MKRKIEFIFFLYCKTTTDIFDLVQLIQAKLNEISFYPKYIYFIPESLCAYMRRICDAKGKVSLVIISEGRFRYKFLASIHK